MSTSNGRKPGRLDRLKEGGELVYSTLFLHSPSGGVSLLVGYLPDHAVADLTDTYLTNAVHILETRQSDIRHETDIDEPGHDDDGS